MKMISNCSEDRVVLIKSKLIRILLSCVLLIDTVGCTNQDGSQPSSIGAAIGNSLKNVANGIDTTAYLFSSDFTSDVFPLLADKGAYDNFVAFINKYQDAQNISEKDEVDIVFQLGIVQYAPDWITPAGWAEINKFYPDVANPTGNSSALRSVELAMNTNPEVVADVSQGVLPGSYPTPPKSLFTLSSTAGETALEKALASVLLRRANLWTALLAVLSVAAIEEIKADQDAVCASGGCTQTQIQEPTAEQGDGEFPPCTPYPAGTVGYIRLDYGHAHYPSGDPHYHLMRVNQDPSTGRCFWNTNYPPTADPPPSPDWVDLTDGLPPLSPP